jgi:hypothetical protein
MQRFRRPKKPKDFETKVKPLRKAVADAHKARMKAKTKAKSKSKLEFPGEWKHYKGSFSHAQHRKCGFCEGQAAVGAYGDVEHYCPKGEVWQLPDDPSDWGEEQPDLTNVKGRKKVVLSTEGYWWLAYEWKNYLLACQICNQAWKQAFFPVKQKTRNLPPDKKKKETPLLLNPFGRRHPATHLDFTPNGMIRPRKGSIYGLATINTCGLHRPSLIESRHGIARRTYERIARMAQEDGDALDVLLEAIYEDGRIEQLHCGMVRIIFERQTGSRWEDLEARFGGNE